MAKGNGAASRFGFTTHVHYDMYNPSQETSTHGRKSLTDLDYSPLKRITLASFLMGVLVSMGGFSESRRYCLL